MNLQESKKFAKIAAEISAVMLVLILLVVIIFLRYRKPAQQTIQPSAPPAPQLTQDPSQKQPRSFDFSQVNSANIPTTLPTYQAQTYNLSDKNYADIAAFFGITIPPTLTEDNTTQGKQVSWFQDKVSLSINNQEVRYKNQNVSQPQTSLTEDQLKQKAADFIAKLSIIGTDVQITDTNYLKPAGAQTSDTEFISASSFADAQILEFSLNKQLNSYPLYWGSPQNTYTTIRITKDGTIIYFYSKIFQNIAPGESYTLKTANEAVAQIQNGQGTIIQTTLPDENGQAQELFRAQPQSISLASITSLRLAYLLPDDITQPIQPIFVAQGTFQKDQNQRGTITIYLPAFK